MPSKQVTDNDNAVYTTSNGAPVARPYAAEKIGLHGPLLLQGPCRCCRLIMTQLIVPVHSQTSITSTCLLTSTVSVYLSV
jgi:hypothetical protein